MISPHTHSKSISANLRMRRMHFLDKLILEGGRKDILMGIRTKLHQHFQIVLFAPEPDEIKARIDCDQIRLLNRKELTLLFPKAVIHAEWLGGLIKSYILVKKEGE